MLLSLSCIYDVHLYIMVHCVFVSLLRGDTTLAGLKKLKPYFSPSGTTTAGNSSQRSDGAAAVLLMKRSKAKALGLPVLLVMRSYAVSIFNGVGMSE